MPQFPPTVELSPQQGNAKDPITVYGFATYGNFVGSPSMSSNKLETYLRFQGLKYEAKTAMPPSAPKGRVPYIQHGSVAVADSHLIIKYLHNTYGDKMRFQEPTDPEKVAVVVAVRRVLENSISQALAWYRVNTNEGYSGFIKGCVLNTVPWGIKGVVGSRVRTGFAANLKVLGINDHNEKDFLPMIESDFDTVSFFLGEKRFLTGDTPTEADATLFAVLDNVVNEAFDTPLKAMVKARPNLASFAERITKEYYSTPTSFPRLSY